VEEVNPNTITTERHTPTPPRHPLRGALCKLHSSPTLLYLTNIPQPTVYLPLIGIALFTLLAGRALTIFGICSLGNSMYPSKFNMPKNEQAVLYAGGLIRGAICWAQVRHLKLLNFAVLTPPPNQRTILA
jgi:hypothetical protein